MFVCMLFLKEQTDKELVDRYVGSSKSFLQSIKKYIKPNKDTAQSNQTDEISEIAEIKRNETVKNSCNKFIKTLKPKPKTQIFYS